MIVKIINCYLGKKVLNENNESYLLFIFNIDGILIFKFSKIFIWLIFFMVNELLYWMWKLRENMVVCGLGNLN